MAAIATDKSTGNMIVTTISNQYIIDKDDIAHQLSTKSLATIYKAKHHTTHKDVAIKLIYKSSGIKYDQVNMQIKQFINISCRPGFCNVINAIDAAEDDSLVYVVCDYYDSGSLTALLNKEGCFSEADALEYLRQICYGLCSLQPYNTIYKNLNTDQILLNSYKVKGYPCNYLMFIPYLQLAANAKSDQNTNLAYTNAPEVELYNCTSKADVFSLGCIFYKMLTQQEPFTGKTQSEIILSKSQQSIPFPFKSHPISELSIKLLNGCLQYDDANRFSLDDLCALLNINRLYIGYAPLVLPSVALGNSELIQINLKEKMKSADNEIDKLKKDVADGLSCINDLKIKISEQNDIIYNLNQKTTEQLENTQETSQLKKDNIKLTKLLEEAQNKLKESSGSSRNYDYKECENEKMLSVKDAIIADLNGKIEEMKKVSSQEFINELKQERDGLKEKSKTLEANIQLAMTNLNTQQNTITENAALIEQFNSELTKAAAANKLLEQTNIELNNQIRLNEESTNNINGDSKSILKQLKEKENIINDLNMKIIRASHDYSTLEDAIKELKKANLSVEGEYKAVNSELIKTRDDYNLLVEAHNNYKESQTKLKDEKDTLIKQLKEELAKASENISKIENEATKAKDDNQKMVNSALENDKTINDKAKEDTQNLIKERDAFIEQLKNTIIQVNKEKEEKDITIKQITKDMQNIQNKCTQDEETNKKEEQQHLQENEHQSMQIEELLQQNTKLKMQLTNQEKAQELADQRKIIEELNNQLNSLTKENKKLKETKQHELNESLKKSSSPKKMKIDTSSIPDSYKLQEVQNIKNEISTLKNTNATLEKSKAADKKQIETLTEQISQASSEIARLKSTSNEPKIIKAENSKGSVDEGEMISGEPRPDSIKNPSCHGNCTIY